MGWEVGKRFKREGTYVFLSLIPVGLCQEPIQYCGAIILQLKINKFKNDNQVRKSNFPFFKNFFLAYFCR